MEVEILELGEEALEWVRCLGSVILLLESRTEQSMERGAATDFGSPFVCDQMHTSHFQASLPLGPPWKYDLG